MMSKQICIVPEISGVGGMVSFHANFIDGLDTRGIAHTFNLLHPDNSVILVIGGTRQLGKLWQAKRQGVPVVQRLNGMNWMHRVAKTPIKLFLRAERNNQILAFIRRFLADRIIYQSTFSEAWWDRVFGEKKSHNSVILNGVDLGVFTPEGFEKPPVEHDRILLVEGHLTGANARGLKTAITLAKALKKQRQRAVELMVVGDVPDPVRAQAHAMALDLWLTWTGIVPRKDIPAIDRSAHLLFSADLNAACPNSVIEALACGLPVAAYDTGALGELVQDGTGEVVPYGSDYWRLEEPVIPPLTSACINIFENNAIYRQRARQRAQAEFGLDAMIDAYLGALEI